MKQKYLLFIMIIFIFLFSTTSLSVLAATPNLELTPSTQSVTVGNQATINLEVEEVTNLRGANIILNFDASKSQYVSSANGGFIPSATLLEQSIDNTNGSVTLDIAGLGASAYASGTGTIMTVILNRIASGDTNITFGSTTLRDKDNITITHTKGSGCWITGLIGDFNADGYVEFEDLMIFAMAYGSCTGDGNWNPVCDLNSDGCIEFEDLMLFAMNYGLYDEPCPPPSAPTLSDPGNSLPSPAIYTVSWSSVSGATSYKIQEATNFSFTSGLQEYTTSSTSRSFSHTETTTTTYYYRVATVDDCGQGSWSNIVDMNVNEGCTSPPVTEVSALALTYHSSMSKIQSKIDKLIEENKLHRSYPLVEPKRTTKGDVVYEVDIEWAGYTGADGYKIYRSVNGGSYTLIVEGNVDLGYDYYSFWDASVTAGSTYSYYVTAYGTGWETCASQSTSTTPLPSCSLISPTNGATISDPTPAFSWSPVGISSYPYGAISSGESDLYVYDETAGSTSWWTYFTNMTTSSGTYNQDGQTTALVSGHSYTWNSWAYGYDGSGKGIAVSASEDWGFDFIETCTPPSPPTLSDPGSSLPSPATYTVSWSSVSGATSYKIQESTSSSFSSPVEYTISSTSRSFSHTVTSTTTYYYRVAAINSCGQGSWSSTVDMIVSVCVLPSTPTLSDPGSSLPSPANYTVSWSSVSGATGYKVQQATSSDFSGALEMTQYGNSIDVSVVANVTTTYYYRVAAFNPCGQGSWSNTVDIIVFPCIVLSPPTLSDPGSSLPSPATYTVSWSSASGATSYKIQEATNSSFTSGLQEYTTSSTSRSFSHTVTSTTTYYYRVAAINSCGQGSWSSTVDMIVVYSCSVPSAPTLSDPGSSLPSPATYTVSWSSASGATSYKIQEATNSSFTSGLQEYTTSSTSRSFSHTVTSTTTYYYRVAAINSCGQGSWSNTVNIIVSVCVLPSTPTLSDPGSSLPSPATYTVSWSSASGATSYKIQEATNSSFTSGLQEYTTSSTSRSFSHTVTSTTTYYYRVAAINSCGQGSWSNTVNMIVNPCVLPAAPTMDPGYYMIPSGNTYTMYWSSVSGAGYEIEEATYSSFSDAIGWSTSSTSKTFSHDNYTNANKTYYYRVRALNSCGYSGWSNVKSTSVAPDPVEYRLLGVGIADYPGTVNDLNAPVYDAISIKALYNHHKYTFAFNNYLENSNATESNILAQIDIQLAAQADPNDISYFYYSGHGSGGTGYASLFTYSGYIYVDELESHLDDVAGTVIVILDACHSGDFIGRDPDEQDYDHEEFNNAVISAFSSEPISRDDLTQSKFKVLTACWSYQTCSEVDPPFMDPYGLFTAHYRAGCGYPDYYTCPASTDSDPAASLEEVYIYIRDNMSSLFDQDVQRYPVYSDFPVMEY